MRSWKEPDFILLPSEMREIYIKELEEKRMMDHPSYKKMTDWRTESIAILSGGTYDPIKIAEGMDVINQNYKACVYVKRAGFVLSTPYSR
jgi:hypothetical protein